MRMRSKTASLALGVALIQSTPPSVPSLSTAKSCSKSLEPNRIEAGDAGKAPCELALGHLVEVLVVKNRLVPSLMISCSYGVR